MAQLQSTDITGSLRVSGSGAGQISASANIIAGANITASANITAGGTITAANTISSSANIVGLLLRIPHVAADPTLVNGNLWSTTTDLKFRLNGQTKSILFNDGSISNINIINDTSSNLTRYVLFSNVSSGVGDIRAESDITYNPSTANLTIRSGSFLSYIGISTNGRLVLASNVKSTIPSISFPNEGTFPGLANFIFKTDTGNTRFIFDYTSRLYLHSTSSAHSAPTAAGRICIRQMSDANGQPEGISFQRPAVNSHWNMYTNFNDGLVFYYMTSQRGYLLASVDVGQIDFTGQHRNLPQNNDLEFYSDKIGLIVVSSGEYKSFNNHNSISINEALPSIKLSSKRNEKSVFGVISDKEDKNESTREYTVGNFVSVYEKQSDDNRLIINSLGEGAIWVCNINGNLENGDYITTCEIPGYGMKQDDDLLHNYTVAKITCDCNFDLNSPIYMCEEFEFSGSTYRKAFVGCTYHCG